MVNNDMRGQFENLINQLNKPAIRVIKSEISYGDNLVEKSNQRFEILPLEVREFYSQFNLVNCKWELVQGYPNINYLDKEVDIVAGEINIPDIAGLFKKYYEKSMSNYLDPFKIFDFASKEKLNEFFPFDFLSSNLAVCYKVGIPEVKSEKLYLVDFSDTGIINPLGIGIKNYILSGIRYKFFYGWQKAIYLKDSKRKKTIESYCNQLFI